MSAKAKEPCHEHSPHGYQWCASFMVMADNRITAARHSGKSEELGQVAGVAELVVDANGATAQSATPESVMARVRANLADPAFRGRLDEILERRKALIERLAKQ